MIAATTCRFGGDVAAAAAAFAFGRQHLHLIADNIGRVTIISAFVLLFSGLQAPLDIHGLAFREIFTGDLGQFAPERNIVPLGALFPLA